MDQKQRVRVLIAIFAGSILTTGVVLAAAMTLAAAMFLAAGVPLPWGVMWTVWIAGVVLWFGGMIPVWKHVDNSWGIIILGVFVFFVTLIINLSGSGSGLLLQTGYYSIVQPILFGILLASTFLKFAVNFVGLDSDEPDPETSTTVKNAAKTVPATI